MFTFVQLTFSLFFFLITQKIDWINYLEYEGLLYLEKVALVNSLWLLDASHYAYLTVDLKLKSKKNRVGM